MCQDTLGRVEKVGRLVTTGARHDNQPYLEQLQRIRERYKITIREAIADRGYGSAAIIEALQEQEIETYIPLFHQGSGRNSGTAPGLVYEPEGDRFRCPEGKYLHSSSALYENYKRYVSSSVDCQHCPRRSTCPTEARKKLPNKRYVRRSLDQDLFDREQARMVEPEFRKNLSERMWKSEGLFAEAKQNHGLARARYRGRSKLQIQAYLIAMAQNLNRLVFLFYCWLMSWWSCKPRKSRLSRADLSPAGLFQHARWLFRHPSGRSPFCLIFRPRDSETAISVFKALESRQKWVFNAVEPHSGRGLARAAQKPNGRKLRITIAYWARAIRRAARFRPVPSLFFGSKTVSRAAAPASKKQ